MLYVKNNNLDFTKNDVERISNRFGFSALTSKILLSRGLQEGQISALLSDGRESVVSHWELPNVDAAAQRIEQAMMTGEKIAVFGDYDADGICATSIIVNSLRNIGYDEVIYYIPNRISEGYGLNNFAIDIIAEQGCSLLITVDCGISNAEEIAYASQKGIDTVVTDHHLPGEYLPDAIIVNPHLGENKALHSLCGAVVALKLMCVLLDEDVYYENCDLAAIATIADMVELSGENRHIVKFGLERINTKVNKNINCLIDECIKNKKTIKADDIAYFIAPAINAAGRLDQADKCVELFTGTTFDPEETAAILAHDNYNRRKVEKETFESALKIISEIDLSETRAIILCDKTWHQGVLGVAASKIKNIFFRPVMLFTENEGEYVGSARSVEGLNIHDAIESCSDYVSHFGGHFMAAGLSIEPRNFDAFKGAFEKHLESADKNWFVPKAVFDVSAQTDDINMSFIKEMEKLEPFGKGNNPPVIALHDVRVSEFSRMGENSNHFRCKLQSGTNEIAAVAFSNTMHLDEGISYDAVISPQKNEWNGRASVQAVIRDIKPSVSKECLDKVVKINESSFELSCSQAFYGGDSLYKEEAKFSELKQKLKMSAFSTAILAMDEYAVNTVSKALGQEFLTLDVRFKDIEKAKTNYNTLIIAPDIERIDLSAYKNVYIVCEYGTKAMYKALRAQGKVYIISEYKRTGGKEYNLDIARLRDIYLKVKKATLNRNNDVLIKGTTDIVLWESRAALRIFRESGLVEYDINKKEFMLTDKKKTDITKSATFTNMQAGD